MLVIALKVASSHRIVLLSQVVLRAHKLADAGAGLVSPVGACALLCTSLFLVLIHQDGYSQ